MHSEGEEHRDHRTKISFSLVAKRLFTYLKANSLIGVSVQKAGCVLGVCAESRVCSGCLGVCAERRVCSGCLCRKQGGFWVSVLKAGWVLGVCAESRVCSGCLGVGVSVQRAGCILGVWNIEA